MALSSYYTIKYCGQEFEIEYEVEEGSGNFNSPGHICDGGADPTIVTVLSVESEQGIALYTDRQREAWEEEIAENHSFDDADDFDDNYF